MTLNGGTLSIAAGSGSSLSYTDFGAGGAGWKVNNDNITSPAFPSSSVLQLTNNGTNQARSVFYGTALPIASGTSGFNVQFTYTPSGNQAAEGFAFVLQNDPRGANALGGVGGNLGYGGGPNSTGGNASGIAHSLAVEFSMNPSAPGGGVGFAYFATNGQTPTNSTLQYEPSAGAIDFNTDTIDMGFSYDPTSQNLLFTISDHNSGIFGILNAPVDLVSLLNGSSAYLGFTGSTGSGTSIMQINGYSYSMTGLGPVSLTNGVVLNAGTTSTIEVATNEGAPATMGPLTVGSGAASTLNVTVRSLRSALEFNTRWRWAMSRSTATLLSTSQTTASAPEFCFLQRSTAVPRPAPSPRPAPDCSRPIAPRRSEPAAICW